MKNLHYQDIALVPRFSSVLSRSDVDTSVDFLGFNFKLPVVPANMATTINFSLANLLADNGYFYILHRFYPLKDLQHWLLSNRDNGRLISISLGVKQEDAEILKWIKHEGIFPHFITLDIAHGYSYLMEKMAELVRKYCKNTKLIVGNVFGDFDSIRFCEKIGADAIKVGLSYGSACTTYGKTGFASPMFSAGQDASRNTNLPLIGDGSIKEHGDIAKGLAAGYSMIMAGGIFAACIDSPAQFINGKKHYYGSASEKNKGHKRHVEGREVLLECNSLTYLEKMDEIRQDLQSAISYSGGHSVESLKKVNYILI